MLSHRRRFLTQTACTAAVMGFSSQCLRVLSAEGDFQFVANYDELKVPDYRLPDPLAFADGTPVASPDDWSRRRTEILEQCTQQMYGRIPEAMQRTKIHAEVLESADDALAGTARRRQVRLYLTERNTRPYIDLLIYLPQSRPSATFLGLNFQGNASTTDDPAVLVPEWEAWQGENAQKERGVQKDRWCFEEVVGANCASVTAHYYDIEPDFNDPNRAQRLHDWFVSDLAVHAEASDTEAPDAGETTERAAESENAAHMPLELPEDGCGAIAEWAWGLSRILDWLETIPDILDVDRVIVHGHSRLGKTALWAGAVDERFAGTISNDSGAGGAAISRRCFGETVWRLNTSFPHWFCRNFRQYNNNENGLPFDQHEVIALCAPRPVLVASAEKDLWADPRGEFLATVWAEPVYLLLGTPGMDTELTEFGKDGMPLLPPLEQPINRSVVNYYIRKGVHDVTLYDWQQWITFALRTCCHCR
ncbi:MAG: acetylxylan esterase [Thermoguttaceae bacterium]|nr:acetylxylan esterase [Thermoguttaceae bacterium]